MDYTLRKRLYIINRFVKQVNYKDLHFVCQHYETGIPHCVDLLQSYTRSMLYWTLHYQTRKVEVRKAQILIIVKGIC